jgi:hypothetical protein
MLTQVLDPARLSSSISTKLNMEAACLPVWNVITALEEKCFGEEGNWGPAIECGIYLLVPKIMSM